MASDESSPHTHSYGQILKSTALMGGSSLLNVGFSIIRNKTIAVVLGPEGIGLMGLFSAIADIAQALAGLGVQASGVRQIAESAGSGDAQRIARTATVIRRTSLLLGLFGTFLLAALAIPVAGFTFGDHQHVAGVALLSIAVFMRIVLSGQIALIQGVRAIGDLARISVLSTFFGTVISIPLIYWFGSQGIVPSLIGAAALTLLTSWWYSRKLNIDTQPMAIHVFYRETAALLKLGFAFMVSALLTMGAAYAIRILVLHADGVAAAGLYQAAWALGGLYASFILQAMGTDFYPRLTAIANDNAACNRLVNEQTQISILLAGPGVLGTLTFAPLAMWLFYSPEFHAATDILRWICLGMMLRIIAWPMGFIVLAKGAQTIFFWTEVAATVVHVGLAWLLVTRLGAVGAGAAFFGLYVWHGLLIYVISRHMTGFRWSSDNTKLGLMFLGASALVFGACLVLPAWQATVLGSAATVASGLYSLRTLANLFPGSSIPMRIKALVSRAA